MSEPTPIPWFCGEDAEVWHESGDGHAFVCDCSRCPTISKGDEKADAALIVRAVNAHATMLAALKECRGYIAEYGVNNVTQQRLAAIDAAISLGEKP